MVNQPPANVSQCKSDRGWHNQRSFFWRIFASSLLDFGVGYQYTWNFSKRLNEIAKSISEKYLDSPNFGWILLIIDDIMDESR
jgi:hypothetical protein